MFTKAKSALMSLAFILVLAVAVGASFWAYKLNHQVDKLQGDVTALSKANDMLVSANDKLVKALDLIQKSTEITDKMAEDLREDIAKINDGIDGMKKITGDRLDEIDKRYDALDDTPENREMRRVDIAMERARGVWRMYCIAEPAAVECKDE